MPQYMYDKDGNRIVLLSEEEERAKRKEEAEGKAFSLCMILSIALLYFVGLTDIGSKIYQTIKSFNDWVFWGIMFVGWLLCTTLLYSIVEPVMGDDY